MVMIAVLQGTCCFGALGLWGALGGFGGLWGAFGGFGGLWGALGGFGGLWGALGGFGGLWGALGLGGVGDAKYIRAALGVHPKPSIP